MHPTEGAAAAERGGHVRLPGPGALSAGVPSVPDRQGHDDHEVHQGGGGGRGAAVHRHREHQGHHQALPVAMMAFIRTRARRPRRIRLSSQSSVENR